MRCGGRGAEKRSECSEISGYPVSGGNFRLLPHRTARGRGIAGSDRSAVRLEKDLARAVRTKRFHRVARTTGKRTGVSVRGGDGGDAKGVGGAAMALGVAGGAETQQPATRLQM